MIGLYDKAVAMVSGRIPESLMLLFARISLAAIFWRSGRTKVEEGSLISVRDTTYFQFSDEPFNNVPILPPDIAAVVTTYAEHILPILLVLGLLTRISATGLLVMTMVIQLFVFTTWDHWFVSHMPWAAMALVLIVRGGGLFSLDHLLARFARPESRAAEAV